MSIDGAGSPDVKASSHRDRDSGNAVGTGRKFDERAGIAFWVMLFGIFVSVGGAILASFAHIDPTQLEAGLVGAFLGSSPVILMPVAARAVFGAGSPFANRERLAFRGLTLLYGVLVVLSRLLHLWPAHTGHTSSTIAIGGLAGAILASWFLPHFPAAARVWARQQLPFHKHRDA
jgi:hypothetical protein